MVLLQRISQQGKRIFKSGHFRPAAVDFPPAARLQCRVAFYSLGCSEFFGRVKTLREIYR